MPTATSEPPERERTSEKDLEAEQASTNAADRLRKEIVADLEHLQRFQVLVPGAPRPGIVRQPPKEPPVPPAPPAPQK